MEDCAQRAMGEENQDLRKNHEQIRTSGKDELTSETSLISKAFFFLERSTGRTAEPAAGQKAQQF